MLNGPLMLPVNWTIVDKMHLKDNKSVTSVKIKARVNSNLDDNPAKAAIHCTILLTSITSYM